MVVCQRRAPIAASASATSAVVGAAGPSQRKRRSRSGVRRFSTGTASSSETAPSSSRARARRAAATGSRSAHALGGGGPLGGSARTGRSDSGSARACGDDLDDRLLVAPHRSCEPRLGGAHGARRLGRALVGDGDLADRGVGKDASGGGVTLLGHAVTPQPQLTHDGETASTAHLVHPGRPPPRVDAGLRAGEVEQVLELLCGPSDLALRLRALQRPRHGGRRAPRRRGRHTAATARAGAAPTSRRRSAPWRAGGRGSARPSRRGRHGAARPDAPRARCRRATADGGRPRRGMEGPGWRRAGSTRRRRWPRRRGRGRDRPWGR